MQRQADDFMGSRDGLIRSPEGATDTSADAKEQVNVTQALEAHLSAPDGIERQQALLREVTVTLLITLVLFIGLHYSAQAVPLDGPSMQPGLHTDERVLVNSLAYSFHGPERGDIIVFHPPSAPSERYIKRVIGLPGDTITLTPDTVAVDGDVLQEPYITSAPFGETENPEAQTIKLGTNQYFVMGDNRTNSQDSRFFGPITAAAIIGQAEFVVWPLNSLHPLNTYPNVFKDNK
jgi:signal peptidase I